MASNAAAVGVGQAVDERGADAARRESERFYRQASDAVLMRWAAERDDEMAFEQLVVRYQSRLYTLALGVCRSPQEAADAAQEGLLAAWRARASFRGESAVYHWLCKITRRKAIDSIRGRERAVALDEEAEAPSGGHDHTAATALRVDLVHALRLLPTEFREAAVMAYILKLPLAQIAEITGVPENTVKTRLFRARARLAVLLGGV
jgi:RNA polymerase sigma-70 factor (ECF subfamily)